MNTQGKPTGAPETDRSLPFDLLDVASEKVQDAKSAQLTAERLVQLLSERSDILANAVANGDSEAQRFVGQVNVLRQQLERPRAADDWMSLPQAASYLGRTKTVQGKTKATDAFYAAVKKQYGERKSVTRAEMDALRNGGLL